MDPFKSKPKGCQAMATVYVEVAPPWPVMEEIMLRYYFFAFQGLRRQHGFLRSVVAGVCVHSAVLLEFTSARLLLLHQFCTARSVCDETLIVLLQLSRCKWHGLGGWEGCKNSGYVAAGRVSNNLVVWQEGAI